MNYALLTVSADFVASVDRRSSVNVRLLGSGIGGLNTNDPRGSPRGDAAFVLGTLRGKQPLHSSVPPVPDPYYVVVCDLRVFEVR